MDRPCDSSSDTEGFCEEHITEKEGKLNSNPGESSSDKSESQMRMISFNRTSEEPSEVSKAAEGDENPKQPSDDVQTENNKSSLGFEIYTNQEQDQPRATGMRSFFRTRTRRQIFEEIKESSNVVEPGSSASDEKKSQSAAWPNIVNRVSSTLDRLRASTPDSVTAVFQKFKPRSIPGSSTNRLGSTLEGWQRLRRGNNLSSPPISADHSRQWNRKENDQRKGTPSRLQNSFERLRVDLQRSPNWIRTQLQRRYRRGPPRNRRDQSSTPVVESSSPQQSPQSSSGRARSNSSAMSSVTRRQQEEEQDVVERSMKMDEILRLPMIQYKAKAEDQSKSCVVCTDDFKEGETLRVLTCFHTFHQGCIDEWLLNYCPWDNLICPVCKTMQYSFLDPGWNNADDVESKD